MDIIEIVKQQIKDMVGVIEFKHNPVDKGLTFELNPAQVKKGEIEEYRVWYEGDGTKIQGFYQKEKLSTYLTDPIYLSNKQEYFWSKVVDEKNIKVSHSGLPNAMIFTLTNCVGLSKITSSDPNINTRIKKIIKFNKYDDYKMAKQEPMTLVEGWGANKVDFDLSLSSLPIISYYGANEVEYAIKYGHIIGFVFKNYYDYNGETYVLLESRRNLHHKCIIEHFLFRMQSNGNEVIPVELTTLPNTANIPQNIVIPNTDSLFAVPTKYFDSSTEGMFGRSVFAGKLDIFDDIDQCCSQSANTVRCSTPVEYIPQDMCPTDRNGNRYIPNSLNRRYISVPTSKGSDGQIDNTIQTTQPQLNFGEFSTEAKQLTSMALVGVLSPCSIGVDLSKRDNAEAQREKEKTTIMTRNSIIKRQEDIDRETISQALEMQDIIEHNAISDIDYGETISVEFNEFASPSYEEEMRTLSPLLRQKVISPTRFMDIVYRNKLGEEEYQKELDYLTKSLEKETKNDNLKPQKDGVPTALELSNNTNHLLKVKEDTFKS